MKKFLLVVTVLICGLSAFSASEVDSVAKAARAQRESEHHAKVQAHKAEMDKVFAKYSRDHIYVDLLATNISYNRNDPRINNAESHNFKTKWYSRGINIGFNWDFRIKGSRVSFAPGIAYSTINVYERSAMVHDSAGTHFKDLAYGSDTTVKVNKISLQYLEIPLELRIRTNPDRFGNSWKVALGFKAGIRVDAHTKEKLREGTATKVYVERRFPDFNLWRMGPTLRVGYSFVNFTAYYGVLNLFKTSQGPKMHEFAVGISFTAL